MFYEREQVQAFRVFDNDGNGVITAQEFRYFMMHMGMQFTAQEVDDMISEVSPSLDFSPTGWLISFLFIHPSIRHSSIHHQ